jgi:hypothetical protein
MACIGGDPYIWDLEDHDVVKEPDFEKKKK